MRSPLIPIATFLIQGAHVAVRTIRLILYFRLRTTIAGDIGRAYVSNFGLMRFSNEKISSHFSWLRSFLSLTTMSWRLLPVS